VTEPILRLTWTDPETGRHGFAVVDTLVGGVAAGGTRLRAGVTLEEVERLAHAMSLKNGSLGIPSGGAKFGVDADPSDPLAEQLLTRFVTHLKPLFETMLVTGEDMGTSPALLDRVFKAAGVDSSLHAALARTGNPAAALARLNTALATEVEGVLLVDLVGGYGVAEAALAAVDALALGSPADLRASIQGFGSMGGSTARYLSRAGVRVVAVADARGTVVNPQGLEVERLLQSRTATGEIDRAALRATDGEAGGEAWLSAEAEILVPAAVADAINESNEARVGARLVVEAANIPTTAGAESRLRDRGVTVVPDFIANSGTNAFLWWLVLGEIEATAESAFANIGRTMRSAVPAALRAAADRGLSPRQAAAELALARLAEIV
jgi:glutamate dehydrogenase (NAD(P)+)